MQKKMMRVYIKSKRAVTIYKTQFGAMQVLSCIAPNPLSTPYGTINLQRQHMNVYSEIKIGITVLHPSRGNSNHFPVFIQ